MEQHGRRLTDAFVAVLELRKHFREGTDFCTAPTDLTAVATASRFPIDEQPEQSTEGIGRRRPVGILVFETVEPLRNRFEYFAEGAPLRIFLEGRCHNMYAYVRIPRGLVTTN